MSRKNTERMSDRRDATALAIAIGGPAMAGRTAAILGVVDEFTVIADGFGQECIRSVTADMLAAAYIQGYMQSENIMDEMAIDAGRYAWLRDGGIHRFGSTLSGDELDEHIDVQLDEEDELEAKAEAGK